MATLEQNAASGGASGFGAQSQVSAQEQGANLMEPGKSPTSAKRRQIWATGYVGHQPHFSAACEAPVIICRPCRDSRRIKRADPARTHRTTIVPSHNVGLEYRGFGGNGLPGSGWPALSMRDKGGVPSIIVAALSKIPTRPKSGRMGHPLMSVYLYQ